VAPSLRPEGGPALLLEFHPVKWISVGWPCSSQFEHRSSTDCLRSKLSWTRLTHGWRLDSAPGTDPEVVRDFVRPGVRAIPQAIAKRLPPCRILLGAELPENAFSRWALCESLLRIEIRTGGVEPHDIGMELLVCVGQALWEAASPAERRAWLMLLRVETEEGFSGEIDEDALMEKQKLLVSRESARSSRRLAAYARASFAGTVAEYVHALWHNVTVRTGPEFLPGKPLRRRLEIMARWYPPNRGYRLFPVA
jgi:hypothetical protein